MKTIVLTDQELALIGQALGALPFNQVAALIENIQTQITTQEPKNE